jgi:hypothetical protein
MRVGERPPLNVQALELVSLVAKLIPSIRHPGNSTLGRREPLLHA